MSTFQLILVPLLTLSFVRDVATMLRSGASRRAKLLRALVTLGAALAIAFPDLTQLIADEMGIGRGTDVVLYLSVLVATIVAFAFHARITRTQEELTMLVRHIAIAEAQDGRSKDPELTDHVLTPAKGTPKATSRPVAEAARDEPS